MSEEGMMKGQNAAGTVNACRKTVGRAAFSCDFFFFWMSAIMQAGRRRPLQSDDLYVIPASDRLEALVRTPILPARGLIGLLTPESFTMKVAGLAMLIYGACQVLSPVALYALLECAEDASKDGIGRRFSSPLLDQRLLDKDAMFPWILVYASFLVLAGLANHWQLHNSYHAGQRLRSHLMSRVFHKALTVNPQHRPATGQLVNLMATDAQKFLEALPMLHQLWANPLQMIVASSLLVRLVGVSAVIGVVVIASLAPISNLLARYSQHYRRQHHVATDERVRLCNEMLMGIRCIKYFAWEQPCLVQIFAKRDDELRWSIREISIYLFSMVLTVMGPVVAFAAMLLGLLVIQGEKEFSASRGFGALALLMALRFPLMNLGSVMGSVVQLLTSSRRLCRFLLLDDLPLPSNSNKSCQLEFQDCKLSYAAEAQAWMTVLSGINLSVHCGEFVVVLGRVGSGKSTLLKSVIGEVSLESGSMSLGSSVAYCPQGAWVLNSTVRENILFGTDLDETWYHKVLNACCLWHDLKQLPFADQTEIGERGVTLSGGQKQRIALARAVYQRRCGLLLLDDVFSALDAHTGRRVLHSLFGQTHGLLKGRTVLLAAHGSACTTLADRVVLLGNAGTVCFAGAWSELIAHPELVSLVKMEPCADDQAGTDAVGMVDQADISDEKLAKIAGFNLGNTERCKSTEQKSLMSKEERDVGNISWRCLRSYVTCMGGFHLLLLYVASSTVERVLFIGIDWWLSHWTTQDPNNKNLAYYFGMYVAIIGTAGVFVFSSRLMCAPFCTWAARRLFEKMALCTVRAPLHWWDTTPMGRVLNRFSFDTEVVDSTLITKGFPAIQSTSWMVGSICVLCGVLFPYSLIALPFIIMPYLHLLQYSRKSIRELQRLDSLSRSPIQSIFAEVSHGVASVRAYGCEARYQNLLHERIDENAVAVLAFNTANRWMGVRLEMLSTLLTTLAGVGCWVLRDTVSPSQAGLCLIWSVNFSISLNFNCIFLSQAEAALTSVERLDQYAHDVPIEGEHLELESWQNSYHSAERQEFSHLSWDDQAPCLSFQDISLRYREDLPLVLHGVSFELGVAERAAVVGRTGAGKSSLAVALFRFVPLSTGRIRLRGQDLATLPLDVSRRCLSIITQDPIVFSGTVQRNLDPFAEYSKNECQDALQQAQLADSLTLDTLMEDAGANRSVGERQLLCLARTVLKRSKLLVCDEATSSVDERTDAEVQQCLRAISANHGTTLLTIAHRLLTVADYDRIIVMEAGRIIEMGSPHHLLTGHLDGTVSAFFKLVEQAGISETKAVHRISQKKHLQEFIRSI